MDFDRARAIIADQLAVPVAQVVDDADFRADLEADSLDLISLTMALENAFDVSIGDDEAASCLTVGAALSLLGAKLSELQPLPADGRLASA